MEVRDRIVMGAVGLMSTCGVRNTTMDSVARSLGISKRTIYENFADKRALTLACVKHIISEQEQVHFQIVSQAKNMIEEIAAILGVMNNEGQFRGRIAADVKRLYPDLHQEIYGTFYHRSFDRMVDQLERGKIQGLIIGSTNSNFAAYVILDSIHSLMVNSDQLQIATAVSPIEAFRYVMLYFFRGIATTDGIEKIDELIERRKII